MDLSEYGIGMYMIEKSKQHLRNSRTSYFPHMRFAVVTGFELIGVGIASIIHGLIPSLFSFTAAKKVIDLYHKRLKNHANPEYKKYALSAKKELDF